jgi:hypothetical protein
MTKQKLTFTKAEALAEMASNTHGVMSEEWANAVCDAFKVPHLKPQTFKHDRRNPKSVVEDCTGIATLSLAKWVCDCMKVEFPSMFGRGSQVRACVESLEKSLEK